MGHKLMFLGMCSSSKLPTYVFCTILMFYVFSQYFQTNHTLHTSNEVGPVPCQTFHNSRHDPRQTPPRQPRNDHRKRFFITIFISGRVQQMFLGMCSSSEHTTYCFWTILVFWVFSQYFQPNTLFASLWTYTGTIPNLSHFASRPASDPSQTTEKRS